jgi:hypothetical protein
MKKFDRILRETYRLLQEQDPNAPVDPTMDPNAAMGTDLGAATPEPAQPEGVLSPAGEVALVKLAFKAVEDNDNIPTDLQSRLASLLPAGAESITSENAKEVASIIDNIVNPAEELYNAAASDKVKLDAMPE